MIRFLRKNPYALLLGSALLVQVFLRYFGKDFVVFQSIRYMNLGLQLGVPFLVWKLILKNSYRDLGWGLPQMGRRGWGLLLGYALLLPLVMLTILTDPSYLDYYGYYRSPDVATSEKLWYFSKFTWTTITGWGFLHRGFLAFGLFWLLKKKVKDQRLVWSIVILQVASFEVLYHLVKPSLEAFGMLLFSPFLTAIALKTKSFWIPLAMHLYLEYIFILYIIFL